jgi:phage shock protein PspC (stress-responsive transcriptional regulator)
MSDKKANSNKFEIDVNLIKAFFINTLFVTIPLVNHYGMLILPLEIITKIRTRHC